MHLTPYQLYEIRLTFSELIARVRELRERGDQAPADHELHLLFTDLDDYPVLDDDETINWYIAQARGLAVGLGFASSIDLFRAYQSSFASAYETPSLDRLVMAADEVLVIFTAARTPATEPVLNGLQEALAPFRHRTTPREGDNDVS